MADLVSSGQVIKKQDSDAIKSAADTALSKTNATHTWTQQPVTAGSVIELVDYTDLKNAINKAYDKMVTGTTRNSVDSDDWDDSDNYSADSDKSGYYSFNSVFSGNDTADRRDMSACDYFTGYRTGY